MVPPSKVTGGYRKLFMRSRQIKARSKLSDLRSFLDQLERSGQLKRVKAEVSVDLEIAEILRRVAKEGQLFCSSE